MKFIWIDDEPSREQTSNNLKAALGVECDFLSVSKTEVSDIIKELLKNDENEPDLILIDHNLINTLSEDDVNKTIIRKGSSAGAIIRDFWKDCPIICVTGMSINEVDTQEKAIYEAFIPEHKISQHYPEILSITESFAKIKKNKPTSTTGIVDLLGAPEEDYLKIISVLPKSLKENITDKSLVVEISNWTRKVLLPRPGFLYNKIWVSTLLGIDVTAFPKVEHIFEPARYKGIFAYEGNERWWKSQILQILTEKVTEPGLPWERGRHLPGIEEEDFSKCYATGAQFPETVAFKDATDAAEEVPIKLKETTLHPDYDKLFYFEDIRIMDTV